MTDKQILEEAPIVADNMMLFGNLFERKLGELLMVAIYEKLTPDKLSNVKAIHNTWQGKWKKFLEQYD